MSFLDRYIGGERQAVWNELIAIGDQVRRQPLLDDAHAVAREIVTRVRRNIELLHDRLTTLGYQFEHPETAFVPAEPNASEKVIEIERQLGSLPLIVHTWYEAISSVDFTQAKAQLQGPTGPEVNGLGSHPALIMHSLEQCWNTWLGLRREDEEHHQMMSQLRTAHPEWYRDMPDEAKMYRLREPFLPTGGTASNCDCRGFQLPNYGIDGVISDRMYFVEMLRNALDWGGFPYCQYYASGNKPLPWEARPNFEKIIPELREGLIPI